jgi:HEAT repeat protein
MPEPIADLTDPAWQRRAAAIRALGPRLDDAQRSALARAAVHDDVVWVRSAAVAALASDGERAAPLLAPSLKEPLQRLRVRALKALGRVGAAGALAAVLAALDDSDGAVREAAARALGRGGPAALPALDALLRRLDDPDGLVRAAVAEALGYLAPRTAYAGLLKRLTNDAVDEVRAACAEALGRSRAEEATDALDRASHDGSAIVRAAALDALASLPPRPRAVTALLKALREDVWRVREAAIASLGDLAQEEHLSPLLARILTNSRSPLVRDGVAEALRRARPVEARTTLLAATLFDRNPEVRDATGWLLADDPGAATELGRFLHDPDVRLRRRATRALEKLGAAATGAAPALAHALRDPSSYVRGGSAALLGRIGAPAGTALPELVRRACDRDAGVSLAAVTAIAALRRSAPEALAPFVPRHEELSTMPPMLDAHVQRVVAEELPDAARTGLLRAAGLRVRFWARLVGDLRNGDDTRELWPSILEAADLAARHAARRTTHPVDARAAARSRELAWQLALLWRLAAVDDAP